jgi:hypothetical protein
LEPKNGQCEWEWGNQGEQKGKWEKKTPKLNKKNYWKLANWGIVGNCD